MDCGWTEYKSKAGQVLFLYKKTTGEHKWPDQFDDVSVYCLVKYIPRAIVNGKLMM